jgi:hypothetical protein
MRHLINLAEQALEFPLEEANRLSLKSAKLLISHLESARGQLGEVLRLNPWLVGISQEAAREHLGARFSVYRAVTVTDSLRADAIASTSLDWQVAFRILDEAPGVVWHGSNMIRTKEVLLHYEIDPAHVVLWVPVVLDFVHAAVQGKEKRRIEARDGSQVSIESVLASIADLNEQEIVADLTGLKPQVLDFDNTAAGGEVKDLFRVFMTGSVPQTVTAEWLTAQHYRLLSPESAREHLDRFRAWKAA